MNTDLQTGIKIEDYNWETITIEIDFGDVNNFDKKIDNFQLEETSVLWTQVSVDFKIQSKNPAIRSQNKIFQTFLTLLA